MYVKSENNCKHLMLKEGVTNSGHTLSYFYFFHIIKH